MPNLCDFDKCCGCSACYAACSMAAIAMRPDKEGFLHPQIDCAKCVNCKLCENACPVLHRPDARKPQYVYAAKAKEDVLRMLSSSGGMFSLLARKVFENGGIVYGAAIRAKDLLVHHCAAENEEELIALRGSKYVQSDMENTYRDVKLQLATGRLVMFTGTPCQVAGLRAYLAKEYANLLCVDIICHATPSPIAWKAYLTSRARELTGRKNFPVNVFDFRRVSFRCKDGGWKKYAISLYGHNGKHYKRNVCEDLYLRGFLMEFFSRPSCYQCSFRELRSGSDVTMADYWGVSKKIPEMDDDRGTSIVLVNTEKGRLAFESIARDTVSVESNYEDVADKNASIWRDSKSNPKRHVFFKAMQKGRDFDKTVNKLLLPPWPERARSLISCLIRKLARCAN